MTNLKWLLVKLDYVGEACVCALRHDHFCVKIYSNVVKVVCPQWLISLSHVLLFVQQLPDPLAKWPHKVLPQQTKVRVEVKVRVRVALGGEVGSKERPELLLELLRSRVDGYGPEVLLLVLVWVGNSDYLMSAKPSKCLQVIPGLVIT